jgi:hypothetical protein
LGFQAAGCNGKKGREGKVFFFVNKKEAKKTLLIWVRAGFSARAPRSESFLLLFFKKEALPLPSVSPHCAGCLASPL